MDFGSKILELRKQKGLSREDLAKAVGTSAPIIGRYERNEITPSVEVAIKIGHALEVSLDYLVGNTDQAINKSLLRKINDIQNLPSEQQNVVMSLLDAFLRDFKTKQAYI